jgi:hypothetical protein
MSKVEKQQDKQEKDNQVIRKSGHQTSWFARKMERFSKATGEFWVMGKQGFIMGSMCGGILGAILGTYESIRAKSFLPLPLSVITMAVFFGGIMGVSSLIRSKDDEDLSFRIVYVDDRMRVRKYSFITKDDFFNKRI